MDDTFNPQNVPPHNPKAFGELLYSLIRTALPQDKPKGGYQKRFAEILGIPYDRLLRWTRGNISNDRNGRSLTPELFIKLVKELWKRGALTTVEQVQIFARCAGEYKEGDIWLSYEALLNDNWFRHLVIPIASAESTPLSDHWVLRSDMLSGVIGKIKTRLGKVVVLQGKPGTGKSTLMAQLAHDKDVQVHFSNRIYRANPNERTALAILRDWYQQCNGITADWGDDEYKLSQDLKRKLQGQHILLLLDGVENPDQVGPLMVQDPSTGVVVIATRFPQIGRDSSPDAEIIEIPGFTPAEAEDYLRSVWNVTSLDDQAALAYQAVAAWVNGNPLALHFAAHRASKIGWPALLALLQEPPAGPLPTDMLEEVYCPLELGYQALPADLQQAFCQIGALPELREYDLDAFCALWNLPENQTKNRLDQLVNQFGALIPHQVESQTIWRIHQQTYYFARDIFERKLSPKDKAAA
ncbi:MAG TPA: ATP-binding protein, partial [Anaerolineaceae bacterium]|nr:ATP-binding protein [Anaerolineaceae bacterium]